ncbi:hypothetical protein EYF80_060452 [Liparis tanakae]|uniref:Uncharacterized protein n=1 Tax=Liparis tanakae TaxID=230148 RepID=A0A4Z2ELF7_9TELE|nr:hypothetical protein EYF80_060452 [Liparis tanakae]
MSVQSLQARLWREQWDIQRRWAERSSVDQQGPCTPQNHQPVARDAHGVSPSPRGQTGVLLESGLASLVPGVQTPEDRGTGGQGDRGTGGPEDRGTGGRSFCDWTSS